MKTGAITISFKEGIKDKTIQNIINKFYEDNEDAISGMTLWQFRNKSVLEELKSKLEESKKV